MQEDMKKITAAVLQPFISISQMKKIQILQSIRNTRENSNTVSDTTEEGRSALKDYLLFSNLEVRAS